MEEKQNHCLQLFDAFEILAWSYVDEVTTKNGHSVKIHGRGFEVDRVKVRNEQKIVSDVKTSQLEIARHPLDFVGDYARNAFIKLEIAPDMFVTLRPGFPAPEHRCIRINKDDSDQLRRAIASDAGTAFNSGHDELRQYLRLLADFCDSWNTGATERLIVIVKGLAKHEVGPWVKRTSKRFYRCLTSFQTFYLSCENLSAARDLLQKAQGTQVQPEMEENLATSVSRRVSAMIEQNQLKSAAEFAKMLPNDLWRKATLEKITRLTKELGRNLDHDFHQAINDHDIDAAKNFLRTARKGAITKLGSIPVVHLESWLDSILDYPGPGLERTVNELNSSKFRSGISKKIKAILAERATKLIDQLLASSDFDNAARAAQRAIFELQIIEKGSSHWKQLRANVFSHFRKLRSKAKIGTLGMTTAFTQIREAADLFHFFDIDLSYIYDFIDAQLATFNEFLGENTTEPKNALTNLNCLEPLSDFIPKHFPYSKLQSFLEELTAGRLRHAHLAARQIASNGISVDNVLSQATRIEARKIDGLLQHDEYFRAKSHYLECLVEFRRDPQIRSHLILAFSKCRRRRELDFFKAKIKNTYQLVFSQSYDVEYRQPELTGQDYAIIAAWNNLLPQEPRNHTIDFLLRRLKEYTVMQHLSARSAEKVALQIYKRLYDHASDISCEQVEGRSKDWLFADLLAKNDHHCDRYIDVKSARSSFSRKDRFSEFCVKRLKTARGDIDVFLSAFFSEYKKLDQFRSSNFPSYLWLGEFSAGQAKRTAHFIHGNFESTEFNIEGFRRQIEETKFIPGWLFDYPESVYKLRNEYIRALSSLMNRANRRAALPADLPDPLMLFGNQDIPKNRPRSDRLIIHSLRVMVKEHGLDRGLLFMTIIAVSLEAIRRGWEEFQPVSFKKYLQIEEIEGPNLKPLGIWDPLGYVDELINCLDTVFQYSRDQIVRFRTFRLVGYGILQGKSEDDLHWTTILAYCGGWNQAINVRCGNTPLVLGVEESCPGCRKLICNECGFCSKDCENCYSQPDNVDEPRLVEGDENSHSQASYDSDIPW